MSLNEEMERAMTAKPQAKISRRRFVQAAAAAVSVGPLIVPRHVLGGVGYVAPSDTFGGGPHRLRRPEGIP